MVLRLDTREHSALAAALLRGIGMGVWCGVAAGLASAIFLHTLAWATGFREGHPWLLGLLPVAGVGIVGLYARWGQAVAGGSNLILERVHNPAAQVPFRMVPLILLTTVLTHLFGGSAGREGTAVQMGGTLASVLYKPLRLPPNAHRLLLMAGISGGFGAVFGTPLAGTVFGLEVLTLGQIRYDGIIPCFVAAVIGDIVTRSLGVVHAHYPIIVPPPLTPAVWGWIVLAGALFAAASLLFIELTHAVEHVSKTCLRHTWMRPAVGGVLVIGLTYMIGTRAYLGLSLPLIARSFTPEGVFWGAFALKIVFTSVTLGTGFKGGEVTPLFCIGATLGAAFAHFTGQPVAFFAALGFVAVFAGAANTPLACILLGMELFGAAATVPLAAACLVSYILTGHRGIYLSQLVGVPKADTLTARQFSGEISLWDVRRPPHPPAPSPTRGEGKKRCS